MTRNKENSKTPDDLKYAERNLIMSRSGVMSQKYNVFMTTAEQLEEIQLVFLPPHDGTKRFEIDLLCMLNISKCYEAKHFGTT